MKKVLAALLALAMTCSLAACGSKSEPAPAPAPSTPEASQPAAPADEKVEVTMIAAQYGNETAAWWADFVKKFNAANENVNLTVDVVSWNDIYTVVNTRIANGEQPDLLNIDGFADYQADDLLLPAEEWVSEETYAKFFDSFLAESIVDDTVWAVPDLASARALYYNADILAQAGVEVPTTWEELKTVCAAIKAACPDVYPWGVDMTTDEGQACFAY